MDALLSTCGELKKNQPRGMPSLWCRGRLGIKHGARVPGVDRGTRTPHWDNKGEPLCRRGLRREGSWKDLLLQRGYHGSEGGWKGKGARRKGDARNSVAPRSSPRRQPDGLISSPPPTCAAIETMMRAPRFWRGGDQRLTPFDSLGDEENANSLHPCLR